MTCAVVLKADCESARVLQKAGLIEESTPARAIALTERVHLQPEGFLCLYRSSNNHSIWHWVPLGDVLHVIQSEDMPEPQIREAFGFAPRNR
jgi:hypothetical protein